MTSDESYAYYDDFYFSNHYQYERVQFQAPASAQNTIPALRELFFNPNSSMPEFAGFMSGLQQQRIIVDQLRREAAVKRISVSQAVEDIKRYIDGHEEEDYLLMGFGSQKANPFREKSGCALL